MACCSQHRREKRRRAVFLNDIEDEEQAEILRIELTEPPLNGYERLSPAVETFRVMQGIPMEQFNDLWLWASQIK